MNILKNRTILIISTEPWSQNFLSKHHLAIALTRLGNRVFFLNPPSRKGKSIDVLEKFPGLFLLDIQPWFIGLRFLPGKLASWLCKIEAARIKRLAGCGFDVIWTFDPFRFNDLRVFKAAWTIYQVADFHRAPHELQLANTATIILGPSTQLLKRFDASKTFCMGHMIRREFIRQGKDKGVGSAGRIRVGYAGNLVSRFIDFPLLTRTIEQNPQCDFTFIGDNDAVNENSYWIQLRKLENVSLEGPFYEGELLNRLDTFDILWCCYETEKYFVEASNSHKILEYLATGKPVVSTRIAYYLDKGDILLMPATNDELPELLRLVATMFSEYQSSEMVSRRLTFVEKHTFEYMLERVDEELSKRS